ncbi:hypothetical protein C2845_PM13G08160 [Panicum miliaceum]|uniref:Uncharacterized protein n=1 Tax=Panicum miliaceum TaxID=4540 RepID=A0A3L6RK07_PANMI|nr:hypothetical protein C2845_PM13G08160 [Panicum miliaceum]
MKNVGRKLSGAFKKVTGVSSSRSRGGSSSHHTPEPTPTPSMMDNEEQEELKEVQADVRAENMKMDDEDASYLDLRSDLERQAFAILER